MDFKKITLSDCIMHIYYRLIYLNEYIVCFLLNHGIRQDSLFLNLFRYAFAPKQVYEQILALHYV